MKWAIFLGSASVGGGTYVIFEHAIRARKRGEDITIITMNPVGMEELYWHKEAEVLTWKTIEEAETELFDVVISTWWRLVYEAYRIKGTHYIYFVQSVESRFYPETEKALRQLAEATYLLPMEIITEATWIKNYLENNYQKNPILVLNGIRKDIYTEKGPSYAKRESGKLRVLVEGPVDVDFKNVPKTIDLCRKSKADEIWLMTSSDIKSYPGVDRTFSKVPIFETPKIYRSCDVIIKLSYVEGMFGPPLEMYHCGGTSITYDVTGHDEYIKHDINGLVVPRDKDEEVVAYINKLKEDEAYLNRLKAGAKKTAEEWNGWDEAADNFYRAVYQLCEKEEQKMQEKIGTASRFHFQSYVIAEDYHNEVKRLQMMDVKKRLWLKYRHYIPQKIRTFGAWLLVDVMHFKIEI